MAAGSIIAIIISVHSITNVARLARDQLAADTPPIAMPVIPAIPSIPCMLSMPCMFSMDMPPLIAAPTGTPMLIA